MDVEACRAAGDQGLRRSPDLASAGSVDTTLDQDDTAVDATAPKAPPRASIPPGQPTEDGPALPTMLRSNSWDQASVNVTDVLDKAGQRLSKLLLPESQKLQNQEIELADIKAATDPGLPGSSSPSGEIQSSGSFRTRAKSIGARVSVIKSEIAAELSRNGVDYYDFGLTGRTQALACSLGMLVLIVIMTLFILSGRKSTPAERAAAEEKHMERLRSNRLKRRGRLAAFLETNLQKNLEDFDGRDLIGSQINSHGDARSLGVVFWTTVFACGAIFIIFILLKRRWPMLFYGRNTDRDSSASRLYYMVSDRVQDKEADVIIERAGLDAWMLLQYYSMNCRLCRTVGSIVVLILCPIHFWSGPGFVYRLSSITISNLPDASWAFWVHAMITFVVVVVSSEILHSEHLLFLKFRFSWLRALPRPQATTLMVQSIPAEFRSDMALLKYFAQFEFKKGSVERAYMVRRTRYMKGLANNVKCARDQLLRQYRIREKSELMKAEILESAGSEARISVIAQAGFIEQCTAKLEEAERALNEMRERIDSDALSLVPTSDISAHYSAAPGGEGTAEKRPVSDVFSHSGFVTFSSRRAAMSASERQYRADPREFRVQFAPEPSDVQYDALAATQVRGLIKNVLGILCLVLLFINCAPMVLLVSSLMNIESLLQIFPWMAKFVTRGGILQASLTGLLGTGLLKIFQQILPKILLVIIELFFPFRAGSWAQLMLQQWYYAYQLLFVVLATAVGASLLTAVVEVIDDPTILFVVLADTIPETSTTYLNFVVLSCAIVFSELLRPARLGKYIMFRIILPRQAAYKRAQVEDLAFTGMGSRMTKAVTMTTVVLLYCSCAPIICIFGYIYFAIGRSTFAFLYRNAEEKKADLGGDFWVEAVNHFFIGLLLYLVLMMGVLGTRASGTWPALLAGSSMIVLFWRWHSCRTYVWKRLPFDEVLRLDLHADLDTASNVRVGEYIQPEFASTEQCRDSMEWNFQFGIWH